MGNADRAALKALEDEEWAKRPQIDEANPYESDPPPNPYPEPTPTAADKADLDLSALNDLGSSERWGGIRSKAGVEPSSAPPPAAAPTAPTARAPAAAPTSSAAELDLSALEQLEDPERWRGIRSKAGVEPAAAAMPPPAATRRKSAPLSTAPPARAAPSSAPAPEPAPTVAKAAPAAAAALAPAPAAAAAPAPTPVQRLVEEYRSKPTDQLLPSEATVGRSRSVKHVDDVVGRSPEEQEYLDRAAGLERGNFASGIATTLGSIADLFLTKGRNVRRLQQGEREYAEGQRNRAQQYRQMADALRKERKGDVRYEQERAQQKFENAQRLEGQRFRDQILAFGLERQQEEQKRKQAETERKPAEQEAERAARAAEKAAEREHEKEMQKADIAARKALKRMDNAQKTNEGKAAAGLEVQRAAARKKLLRDGITEPTEEQVVAGVKNDFPTAKIAEAYLKDTVTTGARDDEKKKAAYIAADDKALQWEQALEEHGSTIEAAPPEMLYWAKFKRNQGEPLPAGLNPDQAALVAQSIDSMSNVIAHEQFGASQSAQELKRHFAALGAETTASPALIRRWVADAKKLAQRHRALMHAQASAYVKKLAEEAKTREGVEAPDIRSARPVGTIPKVSGPQGWRDDNGTWWRINPDGSFARLPGG